MRRFSSISFLRRQARSRRGGAFSLVEVTLAVGIASTALLVILSLIPLGLSSLQDSGRQIVETEIYNKFGSELATTAIYNDSSSTSRVNLLNAQYCNDPNRFPAYFDVEGNELKKTAPTTPPAQTVFTVRCACSGTPGAASDPIAGVWGKATTGELVLATVSIGFHQDPLPVSASPAQAATPSPSPSPNVRSRTFLISNHGS